MADNRYSKGKIYRLVNSVNDEFYVGSTCMPLAKRLYSHKQAAKREPNIRVYNHLNQIGWDNVSIVLIEEYPCENKMELERRERHFIEEMKPTLNKVIPTRTYQEWYEGYKVKIAECRKDYYEKNKDKIAEKRKQYYTQNKEAKAEYMKQYHKNNKDVIADKNKQYREQNKDKINARRREVYALKKAEQQSS